MKRLIAPVIAACSFVAPLSGCLAPPGSNQSVALFQRSALMYLQPEPFRWIYLEIDAVQGAEPDDEVINPLVEFLETHCCKPVTVVRNKPIPREAAKNVSPGAVALQHMRGPQERNGQGPPAYIHVLFYHGKVHGGCMAWASKVYPSVIYVNMAAVRYLRVRPWLLSRFLQHEAGHLLGLCANTDHGDGAHCQDDTCLMKPAVTCSLPRLLLFLDPFKDNGADHLCDDCKADLAKSRNSQTPSEMEFKGPVLVRKEKGYCVGMLPSHRHLSVSPSDFPWERVVDLARKLSADLPAERGFYSTTFAYKIKSKADYLKYSAAIHAALNDPDKRVVRSAKELTQHVEAKFGPLPPAAEDTEHAD